MTTDKLKGARLALLTLALGLGTFIQILDTSIANVAIAYIAGDLAVSPDQGTWVITSFAISNGLILALTGYFAARFGSIKLFIWSTGLFSLTSWLCGLSSSLALLIFFRILQGTSAGMLIPLSQSLLINHYPAEKKGTALGLWSMVVIVAPIMGPVVGGYITDNYGWPWIFYINIPIGLFSCWLTWMLIGDEVEETNRKPFDIIGFLLLTIGISCLQIFLDKGNELDWFESIFIRVMIITSILAFAFFIPWNYYSKYPVMNFNYFKNRNFLLGTILTSIAFMMFFGSTVLLPLWLETQMNYTALWSGIAVMPVGILPLIVSTYVGRAVEWFDPRWMTTISFSCFAGTFFWFSQLTPDASIYKIMEPRFVQGVGIAFFFIPLITISLSSIPNSELAGASGVFNFIRLIAGGGFGTAIYVTTWDRREIFHHSRLMEFITPYNPLSDQLYERIEQLLKIPSASAQQVIENIVAQQSYLLAVNDVFWMTGWAFLVLVPFIWLCKRTTRAQRDAVVGE